MKYSYPAVFMPGVDCYELEFPDINGCFTQGDTINECMEMAQKAIEFMLEGQNLPIPSKLTDIDLSSYPEGSFLTYVCFEREDTQKLPKNLLEVKK